MSSNMKLNFYKTNWYRVSWRDGWQPEGLVLCSIVTRIRDNRHNFLNNETWEKYWGEKSGIYWSWLSWKVLSQIFERGFWKCDSILIWGLFKSWVALWTKEVKNLVMVLRSKTLKNPLQRDLWSIRENFRSGLIFNTPPFATK